MGDFYIPTKKGYMFKCCLCSKYFEVVSEDEHKEIDRIQVENFPDKPERQSNLCNYCYRDADDKGFLKPSSTIPR